MRGFCNIAAAFTIAALVSISSADDQTPPAQDPPVAEPLNEVEAPTVVYLDPATFFSEAFGQIVEEPIDEVPLSEALPMVAELTGMPCRIDKEEFEDDKIDEAISVTLRSDLPLHLALDHLCWEASMVHGERIHWFVKDEEMRFTTHHGYWDVMHSRSYEVGDLLELYEGDPVPLRRLIWFHSVDAQWLDVDGFGGTIEIKEGDFLILQTPGGHREVAAILAAMRSDAQTTYANRSPQIAAVREALQRTIDVSVDGMPLQDAIAVLADQAQVEIHIIAAFTGNPSVNLQQVVKCPLVGEDLRTTLATTLDSCPEQEFGYYLAIDGIWITTRGHRDIGWETVLYDVADIVENHGGLEKLMNAVEGIPEKNTGYFGPRIRMTHVPENRLMITDQADVHEDVAALFVQLRDEAE